MEPYEGAPHYDEEIWGNRIGFGLSPALLMIDFLKAYLMPGAPLHVFDAENALKESQSLLACARDNKVTVVHTNIRTQFRGPSSNAIWVRKTPDMQTMVEGHPLAEFCDAVAPEQGEIVISKHYVSAFFRTNLASRLQADGIDTIVMAGCLTSGSVRASAVDAMQHGFHTMVVRECVADRDVCPHQASLSDIDSKYGDVISKAAAMKCFSGLSRRAL